jgi:hypothetical protein
MACPQNHRWRRHPQHPNSADANVADDAMTQYDVKATGHDATLRRDLDV